MEEGGKQSRGLLTLYSVEEGNSTQKKAGGSRKEVTGGSREEEKGERRTEHALGNHLLSGIRWRGSASGGGREHDHFFGAGPRTLLFPHLCLETRGKKENNNRAKRNMFIW